MFKIIFSNCEFKNMFALLSNDKYKYDNKNFRKLSEEGEAKSDNS